MQETGGTDGRDDRQKANPESGAGFTFVTQPEALPESPYTGCRQAERTRKETLNRLQNKNNIIKRQDMKNRQLYRLAACLVGAATLLLQSCSGNRNCDRLCGSWSSVEGKPDVLIYKEGDAYKVTVFSRNGRTRKLKPETYLLVEEDGNLFINTGYRIDVAYNEAADILTFSPNGDYVRKEVKP